jgi:hypothetical protein
MILRKTHRPGVTLMEVLIATGILAIGMLAIMSLFPIGATSMARAINQTRAADQGANSDVILRHYWKKAWLNPNDGTVYPNANDANTALVLRGELPEPMLNLGGGHPTFGNITVNSSQPGFPILVDPIGSRTQVGAANTYIGGQAFLPLRTTLGRASAGIPQTVRLTSLLDDMTYGPNGEPDVSSGQIERAGRYNVAWMLQRPKNNVPHEVHVRVLVYGGRSATDTPSQELAFFASANNYFPTVDPKPNSVVVNLGGQAKPPMHKGGWVGFATLLPATGGVQSTIGFEFYRVASVIEDSANQLTVEFEQPLRSQNVTGSPLYNAGNGTLTGILVVFENLLEVFDRGVMSPSSTNGR